MTYHYYDLGWAKLFQRSCGVRFRGLGYRGKCELAKGHDEKDHAAERGMEWVRFDDDGHVWITLAGSDAQERYW